MSGFQVGYRVRVLRGRQFSDFKERDEGVILDINEECRNCTVVFDGRPEKIQVALKHLRVIGHSNQTNLAPDGGARSQKVLAKQIAEEMRLADLPAVQALDVELQELRNALQSAQKRLKSYEVKDEKQAEEILELTRELHKVKQEELQSDLATARSEAAAQEMLAQVALQRQELTEERRLVASLQRQVEHGDTPAEAATLHKELELLRSEYQTLAAKESTHAWKEYDLELRSEAATCETLRAELAAEQAQHELVGQVAQGKGGLKKTITEDMQKMLFKAAAEGTLVELLQQKKLSSEILSLQAPDGTTLLHMALETSPTAMVAQMALEREKQRFEHTLRVQLDHHQHCAILNCRAGAQKQTPLQVLCSSPQATREAVVTLLEMQADPSIKDLTGSTAFLDCATHGRCELVRTLLQCSGDFLPHALDDLHRTALHRAALHGHLETVELLLQVSVPVDAIDDDGHTALDYARAHQQIDVMRVLDPKASETSQKVMGSLPTGSEPEEAPKPPSPPETKDVQANGEYATPVFTFADNATEVDRPPPPEDTAGPLPDLRSPPLPGHPQAFAPSPTPPTAPAPIPEAFSQSFSHEIHAPRPQHPQAFGARNGQSFAFNASVPTEGPTVADHLNVFGAAAGPYVHGRESPISASVVPTEGPTAADHFNVYGGGRVATPPPPPPLRGGLGFRSASDTRLGDRFYGGNVNRAASDERLGERSKSLNARKFRSVPTSVGEGRPDAVRGEPRRVSKVIAAPRNLSGVEALNKKDSKDLIHRRGLPMETEPDLEATLNPKDGNEGDSLRKRLGKRPSWNNVQTSPGRRADECDDEPSWGSWF